MLIIYKRRGIIKNMKKGDEIKLFGILFVIGLIIFSPIVSSTVSFKLIQESIIVSEGQKFCIPYGVYNPFEEDTNNKIQLSDSLKDFEQTAISSKPIFVPKNTSSSEAMIIEVCFRAPKDVYPDDCLIGNSLICKQVCESDEMVVYDGEVEAIDLGNEGSEVKGGSGSKTTMSISYPLKIRVKCEETNRNWSVVYLTIALIAAILLVIDIMRRKRKKEFEKNFSNKKKIKENSGKGEGDLGEKETEKNLSKKKIQNGDQKKFLNKKTKSSKKN